MKKKERLKTCLTWPFCLIWLLLFVPKAAFAGHGFVSSFGNIEWLPEPGRTPDSVWYRLDAWQEEGKLLLAPAADTKAQLCLTFAREKLAELEVMVKAENAAAAELAADQYRKYVDRAKQIINDGIDPAVKETLTEQMANALLEHQYILSVVYEELPASTRAVVPRVITTAQERYQDMAKLLPAKKKGALFFKEEEVRWSVQMATRAEESTP
jgi:Domain of unknown function (DUF5667)